MELLQGGADQEGHRVLIVEDDAAFARELRELLTSFGLDVDHAATLVEADTLIHDRKPHLIILDQFIGRHDSIADIGRLTIEQGIPVVMLTGNNDEVDRILALEMGADDFITKVQRPREMLARIRAVLRRVAAAPVGPKEPLADRVAHRNAAWSVKRTARRVTSPSGVPIRLTSRQYECFIYLLDRPGQIVSRDELNEHVLKQPDSPRDQRTVDNLVSQLRRKLIMFTGEENPILSSRNEGYTFVGFNVVEE